MWQRQLLSSRATSFGGLMRNYLRRVSLFAGDDAGLAHAVAASTYAYVCMDLRARAVGRARWTVYARHSDVEITDSPWHNALAWARRRYGQQLLYQHEMALSVWGVNYEEKLVDAQGRPGGLRWLNPIAMQPFVNEGEVQYYEYAGSWGKTVRFGPDEIFYDHYINPSDDHLGLSPMLLALRSVNIDEQSARLILAFYQNDGQVSGIITARAGHAIHEHEEKRIIDQWKDQTQGVDNSFGTVVLPHALEYTQLTPGIPDFQDQLEEGTRRKICASFRVPMVIVDAAAAGDPLSANSTMSATWAQWYEDWWDGELANFEAHYNEMVFPWLMPWGELRFSREKLEKVIRSTPAYTANVTTRYQAGTLTLNEVREKFGDPPMAGGDFLLVPSGVLAVHRDALGEVPALTQQARQPVFSIGTDGSITSNGQSTMGREGAALPAARSWEVVMDEIRTEIDRWERFALARAGKANARTFQSERVPAFLAAQIQAELTAAGGQADKGLIKAIFDAARDTLSDPALRFADLLEAYKDAGLDAAALADLLARIEGHAEFAPLLEQITQLIGEEGEGDGPA
ncbi:MAG: hypothetical protein OHK0046_46510 [Anaerolineae bacterium]